MNWERNTISSSTYIFLCPSFSQVNTLSLAINRLKSWSITLVFVISLTQSSLYFIHASFFADGSFHISIFQYPSSFCTIHSSKLHNFHLAWLFMNYFSITIEIKFDINQYYKGKTTLLSPLTSLETPSCLCRLSVTWPSQNSQFEVCRLS